MELPDTFLNCLVDASSFFKEKLSRSYFSVRLGHWLRISVCYSLKRQDQIGISIGDSCWDFPTFAKKCFPDAGIEYEIYSTNNHSNNIERKEPTNILNEEILERIVKKSKYPLIINRPDGSFSTIKNNVNNISKIIFSEYPLELVLFEIKSIEEKKEFPWNSLLHWKWVFERGEMQAEIAGRSGYSTVSGWKAYARWIQGFNSSIKGNKFHKDIVSLIILLEDRRKTAEEYFKYLLELDLDENIRIAINKFLEIISIFIMNIKKAKTASKISLINPDLRKYIMKCYSAEQETLIAFKLIQITYNKLFSRNKK